MERRIFAVAVWVCLLSLVSLTMSGVSEMGGGADVVGISCVGGVYGVYGVSEVGGRCDVVGKSEGAEGADAEGKGDRSKRVTYEKVAVGKFGRMADSLTAYFGDRARLVTVMKVEDVYAFSDKVLEVHFNCALSEYPIRVGDVDAVRGIVTHFAPEKYKKYKIQAFSSKTELSDLVGLSGARRRWTDAGKCIQARGAFKVAKSTTPNVQPILGAHQLPADTLPIEDFLNTTSSKMAIAASAKNAQKGKVSKKNIQTKKRSVSKNEKDNDHGATARPWVERLGDEWLAVERQEVGSSETKGQGEYRKMSEDVPTNGLAGNNIALWDSHGYYYEQSLLRWEWQRSRMFCTVEDLYTASYVLPFIVPMLENSGAYVLMPRERDTQTEEIVVDDSSEWYSEQGSWRDVGKAAYGEPKEWYVERENPFSRGDARVCGGSGGQRGDMASWMPEFTRSGEYSVYVSYVSLPESSDSVHYTVHHAAGKSCFAVNQRIGGNTWVYLGTFPFVQGVAGQGVTLDFTHTSPGKASQAGVSGKAFQTGVSSKSSQAGVSGKASQAGAVAVADAVRFGGGMGSVARKPGSLAFSESNDVPTKEQDEAQQLFSDGFDVKPEVSGYPRYAEGARYWLQYAGFPQKVYYLHDGLDDYKDDYKCRGAWVNALKEQYDVPVDLTFALHSDAGVTPSDSTVGTLAIYTRFSEGKDKYKNGGGRIIARELADIVQTQVTEDVRSLFNADWSRRGLWDRSYFECRMPDTPSMIMELLSHQNFADMRYGHDPRFKFAVSRAIYKGILKFLATTNNRDYVVQPLPVGSFSAELVRPGSEESSSVRLSWLPTADPLEQTAAPTAYQVYVRKADLSATTPFVLDTIVTANTVRRRITPGTVYSYKIVAVNSGGRSFPSEILSVGVPRNITCADTVSALVVNGYTRLASPASFSSQDTTLAGFATWVDGGSPYISDISFTGEQYDFQRSSVWQDDDAPGFGASHADYEKDIVAGNTFDYPLTHGIALMRSGIPFSSCSREALSCAQVSLSNYSMADFIMGKQATSADGSFEVFPATLRQLISDYCLCGGRLLVSGSYIATDVWGGIAADVSRGIAASVSSGTASSLHQRTGRNDAKSFAQDILKYKSMTGSAARQGTVRLCQNPFGIGARNGDFEFYSRPNPVHYCVESPDALIPVGPRAWTFMRYAENNTSAAVAYRGDTYRTVSIGFPLETLTTQVQLDTLMRSITEFLLSR